MCKKVIIIFILSLATVFKVAAQVDSTKKIMPDSTKLVKVDSNKKGCSDIACHGNLLTQEVHQPLKKGCDKCHQSNGLEHPLKNVKGFALTKEIPGLCFKCHDENNVMQHVHTPVQKGNCLECHTVHNSPEVNLLVINPESKLCEKCHKLESAQKAVRHEPVVKGECAKCHEAHQSDNDKLLTRASPPLCLKCHKKQAEELKMANVHPPFQNNCLNCHAQHSSSEAKLLNLTTQNLCVYCHDDMQKRIENSAIVHGALTDKKSCINCHSPHASAEKKYLASDINHLCLNCHDKGYSIGNRKIKNIAQIIQKSKKPHDAIYKVGCIGCHDPHTSANPNLLTKSYPAGVYSKVSKDNFALCFECHKSEMLEKTNALATSFRNGDVNLHYIHMNGEKGRSCSICHDPHGSPNDKLINETAPFGNWEMPLKFKKIETGGSCAPGCHAEKKYDRVATVQPQ